MLRPAHQFQQSFRGVCLIPKGTIRKTVIMFAALLMITAFASFFLEASEKVKLGVRESLFIDKRAN